MTVFNISGIGSYDYEVLLGKQSNGATLSSKEQEFVLAFGKQVLAGTISLSDASDMNDDQIKAAIDKMQGEATGATIATNNDVNADGVVNAKDLTFVSLLKAGADANNNGALEASEVDATGLKNPVALAYQPGEITDGERDDYLNLMTTQKSPLSESDLELILKVAYNNAAGEANNFQNGMFTGMTQSSYVALLQLFNKDGATADDLQDKLTKIIDGSVQAGSPQFLILNDSTAHQVNINGKLYNISSTTTADNAVAWTIENGEIVFTGSNLDIADASVGGTQADNIKVIGDSNKLELLGGNNFGYVVGDFNSILGGSGNDTVWVEGSENYVDAWKGDDKIYIAGDKNIAYGLWGADNFFVNGNGNLVDGEVDGDSIYNVGSGTISKGIETTLTSTTGLPDFFRNYQSVTPPPVNPPSGDDTTRVTVNTGDNAEGYFGLASGGTQHIRITVGTTEYSFDLTSATAQTVKFTVDENGKITIIGDDVKLSNVSNDEFTKLALKDSHGNELLKQPSTDTFGVEAGETQLLAVKVGSTVYMVKVKNDGTSDLSGLSASITGSTLNIANTSADLTNLSVSVVGKDAGLTDVKVNGVAVITKETLAFTAGQDQSITVGGTTFSVKSATAQAVTYYVDANGKIVFEGNGLEINGSPSVEVNIKGEGNIAGFTNVKFNGNPPDTITSTGTQVDNKANGTYEYHFIYNGATYLVNVKVQNGPASFKISMTNGSILVEGDTAKVSIDSSKLVSGATATVHKPIEYLTTPSIAVGQSTTITVGDKSYTIKNNAAAAQTVQYYVDDNGQLVIKGDSLDLDAPDVLPSAGVNMVGENNIADSDDIQFNGRSAYVFDEEGTTYEGQASGTYPINFSFEGKVYLVSFDVEEDGTDISIAMDANGNVVITGNGVTINQNVSKLPQGSTASVVEPPEVFVFPASGALSTTAQELQIEVGEETYKFDVKKLSNASTSSTSLSYTVDANGKITFTCDGLQITPKSVAAQADLSMVVIGNGNKIKGGSGKDTILAKGNNNYIYGLEGDDILGAVGNDNTLEGSAGDDYIAVEGDDNSLTGGAGMDTLVVVDGGEDNTVSGGDGIDTFIGDTSLNTVGTNVENKDGSGAMGVSSTPQTITIGTQSFNVSSSTMFSSTVSWEINDDGNIVFSGKNLNITAASDDDSYVVIDGEGITYTAGSGNDIIELAAGSKDCEVIGGDGTDLLLGNAVGNSVDGIDFVNFIQLDKSSSAALSDIIDTDDYDYYMTAEQFALCSKASQVDGVISLTGFAGVVMVDNAGKIVEVNATGVNVGLDSGVSAVIGFDDSGSPNVISIDSGVDGKTNVYEVVNSHIDTSKQIGTVTKTVDSETQQTTTVTIGAITKVSNTNYSFTRTTVVTDADGNVLSSVTEQISSKDSPSVFNPYTASSTDLPENLLSRSVFEKRYNEDGTLSYLAQTNPTTDATGILSCSYDLSTEPPTGTINYYAKKADGTVYVYKQETVTFADQPVVDHNDDNELDWASYSDDEDWAAANNLGNSADLVAALQDSKNFVSKTTSIITASGEVVSTSTNKYVNGLPISYLTDYSSLDTNDNKFTYVDLYNSIYSLAGKVQSPRNDANYSAGISAAMIVAAYNNANCSPALRAILSVFTDGTTVTDTFKAIAADSNPNAYTTAGNSSLIVSSELSKWLGKSDSINSTMLQRVENFALFRKVFSDSGNTSIAFANKTAFENYCITKLGADEGKLFAAKFAGMFNADGTWNFKIAKLMGCTCTTTTVKFNASTVGQGFGAYGQDIESAIELAKAVAPYDLNSDGTLAAADMENMYAGLVGLTSAEMESYVYLKELDTLTDVEQTQLDTLQSKLDAKSATLSNVEIYLWIKLNEIAVKKPTNRTSTQRISFPQYRGYQMIEAVMLGAQNGVV